jgi:hypothetical protein
MRTAMIVACVVSVLGCSKSKIDQALGELGDLKDKMCKCEDRECAEKVHDEYNRLGDKYRDLFEKDKDVPKDKLDKADELGKELKKCRREAKRKGKGSFEDALAKMTEFKDRICACADKPCAQKVTDDMTAWSQEMAKNAGDMKPDDVSPDDAKKMAEISKRMGDCSMKVMAN